jgi:uncharacterized protein
MVALLWRYLEPVVEQDLLHKMVLIAGPRQCGKTTLARRLLRAAHQTARDHYLNWDIATDRAALLREEFPSGAGMLVLDEVHKYSRWRQLLKGLYDGRGTELRILVTGSARLDHYRRGGDSLQGRYHFYRMHPLTLAEVGGGPGALQDLLRYGGFPEPFLAASERETRRWSREYNMRLVREEIADLEHVQDVALVERLALRLPDLVGTPLSVNALREDLQVAHATVARWLEILENLFLIFRVYPFGAPKIRAVKKEAKHYHWDWTTIKDSGARLENMLACHLLKWCHFQEDSEGRAVELRYFRDVDGREVDFVVCEDGRPLLLIECKTAQRPVSKGLAYLHQRFPKAQAMQLALEAERDFTDARGIRCCSAATFLAGLV